VHPVRNLFFFLGGSLFAICFLVCIVSMVSICWTVISSANKMEKYTFIPRDKKLAPIQNRINDEKRETIKQALLYTSAFILTYFFLTVSEFFKMFLGGTPVVLQILMSVFYPLQGFWNFIFYIRPRVKHAIKTSPTKAYLDIFRDVIFQPMSMPVKQGSTKNMKGATPTTLPSSNFASNTLTSPRTAGYPPDEAETEEYLLEC